jgi:hypothetical protein
MEHLHSVAEIHIAVADYKPDSHFADPKLLVGSALAPNTASADYMSYHPYTCKVLGLGYL